MVLPTPVFAPYTWSARSLGQNAEPTCLIASKSVYTRYSLASIWHEYPRQDADISPRRHRDTRLVGRTLPRSILVNEV